MKYHGSHDIDFASVLLSSYFFALLKKQLKWGIADAGSTYPIENYYIINLQASIPGVFSYVLYPIKVIDIELSHPLVTIKNLDGFMGLQALGMPTY